MSRQKLTPGAQLNVYRNGLATEFARAVLHELLSHTVNLARTDHAKAIARETLNEPLLALDIYSNRVALTSLGQRMSERFDTMALNHAAVSHTAAQTTEDAGSYRIASTFAADVARHITGLFPDLSCNYAISSALESVIAWFVVTQGQAAAFSYVQAALMHGMSLFITEDARRRAVLPLGTAPSPLLP